jgi:hypothetical protein
MEHNLLVAAEVLVQEQLQILGDGIHPRYKRHYGMNAKTQSKTNVLSSFQRDIHLRMERNHKHQRCKRP